MSDESRPTPPPRAAAIGRHPSLLAVVAVAVVFYFVHGCSREAARDPWGDADAWRRCQPAIDAWKPGGLLPSCTRLHMCANEAPLDAQQMVRLREMIRATPGCADP